MSCQSMFANTSNAVPISHQELQGCCTGSGGWSGFAAVRSSSPTGTTDVNIAGSLRIKIQAQSVLWGSNTATWELSPSFLRGLLQQPFLLQLLRYTTCVLYLQMLEESGVQFMGSEKLDTSQIAIQKLKNPTAFSPDGLLLYLTSH